MFQIVLDPTQKEELGKDIYTTVTDAIEKARQEEQHAKPYLNKKRNGEVARSFNRYRL